jgi:UDP-glucose:(heptosyl)LPS alpha-1,3-glucosyltransferase
MHIAVTVGSFNQLGGIERVTVQLALGYQSLGHEVTIFATDWDAAYEDRFNFEKVNAPAKPAWWRTMVLPKETARRLAGDPYDFIHGQGTSTLTCDLLTFHSIHAAWLEVSVAEEGTWSARGLAKRIYPFHRATIAMEQQQARTHQGLFHACSRAVREEAIKFYGIEPNRIRVVPWGVDLETFQPNSAVRAQERSEWGVDDTSPILLLVANEFHRKGLATLLEAMAQLGQPELQLVVVGRGNPEPYLPLIERLGLKKQVRFLGHRSVAACYQAADLFVMPTTYEAWGLVIGEALACGLPIITSRLAGASDLIVHGQNGFLLQDPRSVSELAEALHTALVPETRRAMAAAARPSVLHTSWLQVSQQLLALGCGVTENLQESPTA